MRKHAHSIVPFGARKLVLAALATGTFLIAYTQLISPTQAAPAPKVQVCHFPPGNPGNWHTIEISENAVAKHIENHGDLLGACNAVCAFLCDDGNACTIDDTGECEDVGCPGIPEAVDCNDSNSCTADSCDPATGCENNALSGTTCVVSDPGTCEEGTGICDTLGVCDPDSTPGCCVTTADCEAWDTNHCSNEECLDHQCETTSINTCETDACHLSVCIPEDGSCTPEAPIVCDQLECHDNGCDPESGCYSNLIEGCCIHHSECNDGNNCTTDTCLGVAGCVNVPCASGDACNVLVSCDPFTCAPTTVPQHCDDGDACTADSCDQAAGGCIDTPVDCDDGNECTAESCDAVLGCASDLVVCPDDGDLCTAESCDPLFGCGSDPVVCADDGDLCTIESCDAVLGCGSDPVVCADDGDLCTIESCEAGVCGSTSMSCNEGELCDSATGTCEPECFTSFDAAGSGDSISACIEACQPHCPSGICELKFQNVALVEQCLNDGDLTACLTIDQFGAANGCNICDPPEPEGPDLLLCGGSACARYDGGLGDLANPVVRNFLDAYTFVDPRNGVTKGFSFAQSIGADGFLWAATNGNNSDNFTDVWLYDPDINELVSCESFGASTGGSCEDSELALNLGNAWNFGSWFTSRLTATHVPGGIYATGGVGFQFGTRSGVVRLGATGTWTNVATWPDVVATCSAPGLHTEGQTKLAPAAAPRDPADPGKEELYTTYRYAGAPVDEHWIVKLDVQSGTCSEIAVLNSEAGSNTVPALSRESVSGILCGGCGLKRIRIAEDGTIYFLIWPVGDTIDDGIWRMADTDMDGDIDGDDIIEKIVDWVFSGNEMADFTIGPHDGNLYVVVAGRVPTVDRVTIYEPNIVLGDPPLGTVFNLPATHGTQTQIDFFPLN